MADAQTLERYREHNRKYASLKVFHPTLARVRAMKLHPRETDDQLVNRIADMAAEYERERRESSRRERRRQAS